MSAWRGRRWVVETDIANCFEAIPHERLMAAIEERIVDRHVLKLLRAMLRAGVMEDGAVRRGVSGTPQGGVISPLLCNVYLHRLDRHWQTRGHGVLVRYADDLVVMCQNRGGGRGAPSRRSGRSWPSSGLSSSRPRRGSCTCGKEARASTSSASITAACAAAPAAPGTSPSSPAGPHVRRCSTPATASVRLTARERLLLPVEEVVQDVNRFLRGWAGYFRYGNSARPFDKIDRYAVDAARALRGQTPPDADELRLEVVAYQSPNRMGLINLNGPSSRHDRTGRGGRSRMPAVKDVGEPCAGEPHARFDGGREETSASRPTPRGARRLPPTRPPSANALA